MDTEFNVFFSSKRYGIIMYVHYDMVNKISMYFHIISHYSDIVHIYIYISTMLHVDVWHYILLYCSVLGIYT